ncbi:MAG: inositol monophosphatase family protein [Trueperaceae bacterium]|nr:inositol monophosphatase family protein [Trueperaceae bacterium]
MTRADADLAAQVAQLAQQAGRAILEVYDAPNTTDETAKEDGSPLTRADLAAHRVLMEGLQELTPNLPVLSEESDEDAFAARYDWTRYWLIDPLDGTKEFLNRNGEFTVNVALIEVGRAGTHDGPGRPVLGVVHVPVTGVTYSGVAGVGAWRDE